MIESLMCVLHAPQTSAAALVDVAWPAPVARAAASDSDYPPHHPVVAFDARWSNLSERTKESRMFPARSDDGLVRHVLVENSKTRLRPLRSLDSSWLMSRAINFG